MYSHCKPFLYNMTVSLIQYIVTGQLHMAIIGDGLQQYVCTTLSACTSIMFLIPVPLKNYGVVSVMWLLWLFELV